MLRNGQGWILRAQLGHFKTGHGEKGLFKRHLWCLNNRPRKLWARPKQTRYMK